MNWQKHINAKMLLTFWKVSIYPLMKKSVANLAGYLLKAVCYAELGYNQSALNSINVILSMSRWTINPFYHSVLKNSKKNGTGNKEFNL